MAMMRAARLHQIGSPMQIDEIPVPTPEVDQVLVRVEACGVVPNLGNRRPKQSCHNFANKVVNSRRRGAGESIKSREISDLQETK